MTIAFGCVLAALLLPFVVPRFVLAALGGGGA